MTDPAPRPDRPDDSAVPACFRAIAARQSDVVSGMLEAPPGLAAAAIGTGATRYDAHEYFLDEIRHYVYAADTALHVAAAAHRPALARMLVGSGAGPSRSTTRPTGTLPRRATTRVPNERSSNT